MPVRSCPNNILPYFLIFVNDFLRLSLKFFPRFSSILFFLDTLIKCKKIIKKVKNFSYFLLTTKEIYCIIDLPLNLITHSANGLGKGGK